MGNSTAGLSWKIIGSISLLGSMRGLLFLLFGPSIISSNRIPSLFNSQVQCVAMQLCPR